MVKRKRAKSDYVQLNVRMKESLRREIEKAADRSEVSMNSEVVKRLERSFAADDQFGGPEMLNMARLMAAAFLRGGQTGARACGHPKWSPATWIEDPTCYIAAITAVADALVAAGPIGLKYTDDVPCVNTVV